MPQNKRPNSPKAIVQRHSAMVDDPERTPAIERAIRKIVKAGDSVFDLGCGLGVLTIAALKAGADRVDACDIDESIQIAKKRVKEAGFENQVRFHGHLSSDVSIPEKADVLLAETVGSLAFDENILPFVIDARDRLLKKNGTILPAKLKLFVAPLGKLPEGIKALPPSKAKTAPLIPFQIAEVKPPDLIGEPLPYVSVDLKTAKEIGFDLEMVFKASRNGSLVGFAGWMEVTWAPGIVTDTSPSAPLTHWKQTVLPNGESIPVQKGQEILFRLRIVPKDDECSTESSVEWGYKVLSPQRPRKTER